METTMMRRAVLGALSLPFLLALGGALAAQGHGGGGGTPPLPNPEIVFVENSSKNKLLRVMNRDGSNVRTVVTGGKADNMLYSCWSPDGTRIAFVATLSAVQGLWVVSSSGTGLQRIVSFSYGLSDSLGMDWSPRATPDGSDKIAFQIEVGGVVCIFVVNPDGSGLRNLGISAAVPLFATPNLGGGIGWNHDATALVVVHAPFDPPDDFALWHLEDVAGQGLTVTGETWLPSTPSMKFNPRAANLSDRIVYSNMLQGWSGGLAVFDLASTPPVSMQLTFNGAQMASFSPDDTRLVYELNLRIYTCAADGSGAILIRSSNSSSCKWPNWRRN